MPYLHPVCLSDVGVPLHLWGNSILSGREGGRERKGEEGGGGREGGRKERRERLVAKRSKHSLKEIALAEKKVGSGLGMNRCIIHEV